MSWISVRNWRKFQHYDPAKRNIIWIKTYTELLDDEAYLALPLRLRGLLHGLWLAYARSDLGSSPAVLGRKLGDSTVRQRDLEALQQAGFISIVASKTLASRYHIASLDVDVDVEEEKTPNPQPVVPTPNGEPQQLPDLQHILRDMPL